jgi:hypothetical protein
MQMPSFFRWRTLTVVALTLLAMALPTAASAAGRGHLTLLAQNSHILMSPSGTANLSLALDTDALSLTLSLFPRVSTRSGLAGVIANTGVGGQPLSSTMISLPCSQSGGNAMVVAITSSPSTPGAGHCGQNAPKLSTNCGPASCTGIYPLEIVASGWSGVHRLWTLLSITSQPIANPLHFTWIVTSDPGNDAAAEHDAAVTSALAASSQTLSLALGHPGLTQQSFATSDAAAHYRDALDAFARASNHRLLITPPPNIDWAGLVHNNLAHQMLAQLSQVDTDLATFTSHSAGGPLVLRDVVGVNDVLALHAAGIANLVLPEANLGVQPSNTLHWGTPFRIPGAPQSLAVTSDSGLNGLVHNSAIDPVRRANLVAGTLDLLYLEAPYSPVTRSVVVTTAAAQIGVAFVQALLSNLAHDPFTTYSSLGSDFRTLDVGGNRNPISRDLLSPVAPAWNVADSLQLASLARDAASFATAISSLGAAQHLSDLVLASETRVDGTRRSQLLARAAGTLQSDLAQFQFDQSPITLAEQRGSVPITMVSKADYSITGLVTFHAAHVDFHGATTLPVVLDGATTAIPLQLSVAGAGNATLDMTFTTPDGQLTITHSSIQIRTSPTSVVGFILSFGSLFVLALWWWRTVRRPKKGASAS